MGFDELYEFLRGKRHSLDRRFAKDFIKNASRAMTLEMPKGINYELHEIVWDVTALRALLANTLESHNLSTSSLLKAWDQTGDGALNRTEFLQKLQGTFFRSVTRDGYRRASVPRRCYCLRCRFDFLV